MAVVVAGRGAVDIAQPRDGLERVGGAGRSRSRHDRRRQLLQCVGGQAVRLRIQRGIANRIMKAQRIELGRQVAEAANLSRQGKGGNAGLHVIHLRARRRYGGQAWH